MRKSFLAVAFMLSLALLAGGAWAKTVKIATFQIPLMVESKDKGVFIDLVKEVAKRTGDSIEIVVMPPKRTVGAFHGGKVDGFFPCLDVLLQKEAAKSEPIYVKQDFAFTRSDSPLITSIAGLEGKKVGITIGYPYAKAVMTNPKIKLEAAASDVLNMKKLSKGRIDVFVVEEKTGLKALKESGAGNIHYPQGKPLSKQDVYFAFQPTPEGKALAQRFSKALADMKKDGSFAAIMSKAK